MKAPEFQSPPQAQGFYQGMNQMQGQNQFQITPNRALGQGASYPQPHELGVGAQGSLQGMLQSSAIQFSSEVQRQYSQGMEQTLQPGQQLGFLGADALML